jgi:hypothetical protein
MPTYGRYSLDAWGDPQDYLISGRSCQPRGRLPGKPGCELGRLPYASSFGNRLKPRSGRRKATRMGGRHECA